MIIIADENIDHSLIKDLSKYHQVISIYFEKRGIDDNSIVKLAMKKENCIILTEDKDFGELVFSHHIKNISVVLLRYSFSERDLIHKIVIQLFNNSFHDLLNKFTTVTPQKIRTRILI